VPEINKKRLKKGIALTQGKPLRSFGTARAYWVLCAHPKAIFTTIKFFATVIKNYLFSQYFRVLHLTRQPIISVDHPLDRTIPFTPEKVEIYFRFIDFWIEPMSMMLRRYGILKGADFCKEWLRAITKTYAASGFIYRKYLSTTNRPDYKGNALFKLIHRLDPHYLCVPSLHIAIIILCSCFYQMLLKREGFSQEEQDQWNSELYAETVAIAESVLFIKQHSVNCIPAAMYMMTCNFPEFISKEFIHQLIEDMFKNTNLVAPENIEKIRNHMKSTYDSYLKAGEEALQNGGNWYSPIHAWLEKYDAEKIAAEWK